MHGFSCQQTDRHILTCERRVEAQCLVLSNTNQLKEHIQSAPMEREKQARKGEGKLGEGKGS